MNTLFSHVVRIRYLNVSLRTRQISVSKSSITISFLKNTRRSGVIALHKPVVLVKEMVVLLFELSFIEFKLFESILQNI